MIYPSLDFRYDFRVTGSVGFVNVLRQYQGHNSCDTHELYPLDIALITAVQTRLTLIDVKSLNFSNFAMNLSRFDLLMIYQSDTIEIINYHDVETGIIPFAT